jgi:hypothetical protein
MLEYGRLYALDREAMDFDGPTDREPVWEEATGFRKQVKREGEAA